MKCQYYKSSIECGDRADYLTYRPNAIVLFGNDRKLLYACASCYGPAASTARARVLFFDEPIHTPTTIGEFVLASNNSFIANDMTEYNITVPTYKSKAKVIIKAELDTLSNDPNIQIMSVVPNTKSVYATTNVTINSPTSEQSNMQGTETVIDYLVVYTEKE